MSLEVWLSTEQGCEEKDFTSGYSMRVQGCAESKACEHLPGCNADLTEELPEF